MTLKSKIQEIDKSGMKDIIKDFPNQVAEACAIGKAAPFFNDTPKKGRFLVLGMGGSAIGGDLIKAYVNSLDSAENFLIEVNRNYDIPANLKSEDNVIVSSYSGNTEETISGLKQSLKKTRHIISLCTGGTVEKISKEEGIPVVSIPAGFQPRAAVGFSFFPMLHTLLKTDFIKKEEKVQILKDIDSTIELLKEKSAIYSDPDNAHNIAAQIAQDIYGSVPVIYSAYGIMEPINLRWRCQIQENAKNAVFGNCLPEMNHNEINSWSEPRNVLDNFTIILMQDNNDNPRTKIRFGAIEELLSASCKKMIKVESHAASSLERMFDMLYLGDWVSYYLAILNNQDPTPIPLILQLKDILSKSK